MREMAVKFIAELTWVKVLLGLVMVVATIVIGALVARFILLRLPATYFLDGHCRDWWPERHPWLRRLGIVLKNLLGVVLVLVGIVLIGPGVPGPGLITILIGITLLDFPGKRRLERRIVGRPSVLNAINAMRARQGRPPLLIEEPPASACPDERLSERSA